MLHTEVERRERETLTSKFGGCGAGVGGNEDDTPDDTLVGQQVVGLVGQIERQHLVHDRLQFPLGGHRQHLGQVLPAGQCSGQGYIANNNYIDIINW